MYEVLIGSFSALLGTLVGWILNNISNNSYKADLFFSCGLDNLPPCLVIYCRGSKPIVLRKIEITINNGELLGKKEFFSESIELGRSDIFCVAPGECKKIIFTVDELVFGDGHFTNISSGNKEQKLKLCVTDLKGKKYRIKTKCTLDEYRKVIEYYDEVCGEIEQENAR